MRARPPLSPLALLLNVKPFSCISLSVIATHITPFLNLLITSY